MADDADDDNAEVFVKGTVKTETVTWKISSIAKRVSSGKTVSTKEFAILSTNCIAHLAFTNGSNRMDFASLTIKMLRTSLVAMFDAWVVAADGRSTNRHTSSPAAGKDRLRLISPSDAIEVCRLFIVADLHILLIGYQYSYLLVSIISTA